MSDIKIDELLKSLSEIKELNNRLETIVNCIESTGEDLQKEPTLEAHSKRAKEIALRAKEILRSFDELDILNNIVRIYQDTEEKIIDRLRSSYSYIHIEELDIVKELKGINIIKLRF